MLSIYIVYLYCQAKIYKKGGLDPPFKNPDKLDLTGLFLAELFFSKRQKNLRTQAVLV